MYTLRTMTAKNKQINQEIGNVYSLIERDFNYEEFSDAFKIVFGRNHVADLDNTADDFTKECHAFIECMGATIPLYKHSCYYIMTESGKTFSNLSYK